MPEAATEAPAAAAAAAAALRLLDSLAAAGVAAAHDACAKGATPGSRFFHWESAGVPLRAELGAREAAAGAATLALHPALASDALALRLSARPELAGLLPQRPAAAVSGGGGGRALRLAAVPIERAAEVCMAVLEEAAALALASEPGAGAVAHADVDALGAGAEALPGARPGGCRRVGGDGGGARRRRPRLLPNGHCSKLHLWRDLSGGPCGCPSSSNSRASGAPGGDGSNASGAKPCPVNIRHLLRLGPPCHCRVRRHVSMQQLLEEAGARLLEQGGLVVQRWEGAAEPDPPHHATLFVSGLPQARGPGWLQQRLAAALKPYGLVRVQAAQGFRGRSRGWARAVVDAGRAEEAIAALDGRLVIEGAAALASVSHATGRADALFSRLPFDARCALRVDDVAAYSVMDDVSATAMADLAAVVTAAAAGLRPPAISAGGAGASAADGAPGLAAAAAAARGLSCADVTACCGGTTLALAGTFGRVTAVELDPERAADLEHNLRVAGVAEVARIEERDLGSSDTGGWGLPGGSGGGGDESGGAGSGGAGEGFGGGGGGGGRVRVLCGDAVALLERLGWHDCCVVDPPWGGPGYHQQQQPQQQQQQGDPRTAAISEGSGGGEEDGPKEGGDADSSGDSRSGSSDESGDESDADGGGEAGGAGPAAGGPSIRAKAPAAAARPPPCSDLPLGGEPLSRLCARLRALCRVAVVRVPRRGFCFEAFSEAVAAGCLGGGGGGGGEAAGHGSAGGHDERSGDIGRRESALGLEPLIMSAELGRSQLLLIVYGGALVAEEQAPAPSGRARRRWQLKVRGGSGCGDGSGGGGGAWRLPEPCSVFVSSRGCFVRCERDVLWTA